MNFGFRATNAALYYYFKVTGSNYTCVRSTAVPPLGEIIIKSSTSFTVGEVFFIYSDGANIHYAVDGEIVVSTPLIPNTTFKLYAASNASGSNTITNIRFYPTGKLGPTGPRGPTGPQGPTGPVLPVTRLVTQDLFVVPSQMNYFQSGTGYGYTIEAIGGIPPGLSINDQVFVRNSTLDRLPGLSLSNPRYLINISSGNMWISDAPFSAGLTDLQNAVITVMPTGCTRDKSGTVPYVVLPAEFRCDDDAIALSEASSTQNRTRAGRRIVFPQGITVTGLNNIVRDRIYYLLTANFRNSVRAFQISESFGSSTPF